MVNLEKSRESSDSKELRDWLGVLKKKVIEKNEVKDSFFVAKWKLEAFMSSSTPDTNSVDDKELKAYHFETVNRWPNVKPHPKMVIAEVKTLRNDLMKKIDSFLKANPAKVLELQKLLNRWINDGERSETGYYIPYIDLEQLMNILKWTWMELDYFPPDDVHKEWTFGIKEDGLLWPQTFAAITCIRDEYRNNNHADMIVNGDGKTLDNLSN